MKIELKPLKLELSILYGSFPSQLRNFTLKGLKIGVKVYVDKYLSAPLTRNLEVHYRIILHAFKMKHAKIQGVKYLRQLHSRNTYFEYMLLII